MRRTNADENAAIESNLNGAQDRSSIEPEAIASHDSGRRKVLQVEY